MIERTESAKPLRSVSVGVYGPVNRSVWIQDRVPGGEHPGRGQAWGFGVWAKELALDPKTERKH